MINIQISNLNKNNNVDVIISNKNFLNFYNYLYLPSNTMFENQETFVNTEELIKRTTKLLEVDKEIYKI